MYGIKKNKKKARNRLTGWFVIIQFMINVMLFSHKG